MFGWRAAAAPHRPGAGSSTEDPSAPAKVATKVAKAESKFVIKGGYIDGKLLDKKGVEAIND